MSDAVKAEVQAVRALKHSVVRYAQQLRDAASDARRELDAADRRAQEAVERRRSEVRKREQDLREAEAALRQCRENCGGLQRQVQSAGRRQAEATGTLERARKAADLTATARSDLLTVLQSVDAAVGEHSSVAASALTMLDHRLAELPNFGIAHTAHKFAVGAIVGADMLTGLIGLSQVADNALRSANVNTPVPDETLVVSIERREEQERNYVLEQDLEAKKKRTRSFEDRQAGYDP